MIATSGDLLVRLLTAELLACVINNEHRNDI